MDLHKSSETAIGSDRILGLIKRRGPQRVADIAIALDITSEAARQQLARLARLGLVEDRVAPQSLGRPAREWSLTASGHARFPDRHADLTIQLLDAVRAEFGERAIDRMIDRRETEMRESYKAHLATKKDIGKRVAGLAEIRSREGYMAVATRIPGGWSLIENHCPICTAATACQGFCRSELDVFRDVLGPGVSVERTDHILAGARRCAYRVTPVK
jgi:predicted ArsR family transcriptional regulator